MPLPPTRLCLEAGSGFRGRVLKGGGEGMGAATRAWRTQVINTVMRGMGSGVHGWRYSSRSTLWGQSGSGNNW
jgi:hypothetical protein